MTLGGMQTCWDSGSLILFSHTAPLPGRVCCCRTPLLDRARYHIVPGDGADFVDLCSSVGLQSPVGTPRLRRGLGNHAAHLTVAVLLPTSLAPPTRTAPVPVLRFTGQWMFPTDHFISTHGFNAIILRLYRHLNSGQDYS